MLWQSLRSLLCSSDNLNATAGESAVGESVAKRSSTVGNGTRQSCCGLCEPRTKLAHATGRNDFEYEFYVVLDDLNAFAAGRKVFVNAGAITHTKSEAELAGLLAHELSTAFPRFQLVAEGNLVMPT